MQPVTISLEPEVLRFYAEIAQMIHTTTEQVIRDTLFQIAGTLSIAALKQTDSMPDGEYFS